MNKILARIPSLAVITLVFVVVFIRFGGWGKDKTEECHLTVDQVRPFLENAQRVEKHEDSCVFNIYGKSGEIKARAVSVLPGKENPGGYGGKIRLVVFFDLEDKVLGINPTHYNETKSFIRMLEGKGFFNNWNGHLATEALNKDVDTVTGATMSTRAVVSMVKSNLSAYTGETSKLKEKTVFPFVRIGVLAVLVFALFSCFFPAKFRKFRTILLVLSVVFMGVLGGKALSLALFNGWLRSGVSSWMWDSFLIAGAAVFVPFFTGRNFYCSTLCPVGALQELICKIPLKKYRLPKKASNILLIFKPVYLLFLFGLMLLGTVEDLSIFEPFSAFQFKAAGGATLIVAGLIVLTSLFISKPWCRYFCPTGELIESIRRVDNKNVGGKKNEINKGVDSSFSGRDRDNDCGSEDGEKNV